MPLTCQQRERRGQHGPPAFAGINAPRRCTSPACGVAGGAVLARHNNDPDGLCGPCRAAGRGPRELERYDLASLAYKAAILEDLCRSWGEFRHLEKTVGGDHGSVRDALRRWERIGFVFEAAPRGPGYRVIGCDYRVWLRPLRAMTEALDEDVARLPDPNQMTITMGDEE